MSVKDLKTLVKDRIESVKDEYILEEILNLIDFESGKEDVFIIPADHQKELEISLDQMENGDTLSHEEVFEKVQIQNLTP